MWYDRVLVYPRRAAHADTRLRVAGREQTRLAEPFTVQGLAAEWKLPYVIHAVGTFCLVNSKR